MNLEASITRNDILWKGLIENLFPILFLSFYRSTSTCSMLPGLLALKRKKLADDDLLSLKVDLVRQLVQRSFESDTIRSLFNFIRRYVNFARPETAAKFEAAIEVFIPNRTNMGIEEIIIEMARQEKTKGKQKAIYKKVTFFKKSAPLNQF